MEKSLKYLLIVTSFLSLFPKEAYARCGYRLSEANIFGVTLPIENFGDVNHPVHPLGNLGSNYGYLAPARGKGATGGAHYDKPDAVAAVTINPNESFQKIGDVIGRISLNYTQGKGYDEAWGGTVKDYGYQNKHLLFECRTSYQNLLRWLFPVLHEYFAVNTGWGGVTNLRPVPNMHGVFYTRHKYLGIRVINNKSGQYFSQYWQGRALNRNQLVCAERPVLMIPLPLVRNVYDKEDCSDSMDASRGRVFVPASAFSGITVEFVRVNNPNGIDVGRSYLFYPAQPIAYTLFQNESHYNPGRPIGTGYEDKTMGTLADFSGLSGDGAAGMNNLHYFNYPMIWRPRAIVTRVNNCRIKDDYTKAVDFGAISAHNLNNGWVSAKNFTVSVICSDAVGSSGTGSNQVSMGFLVKGDKAIRKAQDFGLHTTAGGLTYLLDNEYDDLGVAKGVGIQIKTAHNSKLLTLLSDRVKGSNAINAKGWYGYRDLAPTPTGMTDGLNTYTGNFIAELKKLTGHQATAGSVNAELEIVLTLQ